MGGNPAGKKKRLKVLFYGYNGENNTGSESRLVTIVHDVRRIFGEQFNLDMEAIVIDAGKVRRYMKDPDVRMVELGTTWPLGVKWIPKVIRLMFKKFDFTILVEGSAFTDHFSAFLLYSQFFAAAASRIVGCKVVAYASDCGKLQPFNRKLTRFFSRFLNLIIMRSHDASDRMRELGVEKEIITNTDTAFQYQTPPTARTDALIKRLGTDPSRPLVGLAPKEFFWWPVTLSFRGEKEDLYRFPYYHTWGPGDKENSARVKNEFKRYIDYCVKDLGATVLVFCMERMDYPPSKDIFDMLDPEVQKHVRLIPSNEFDLEDITGLFSRLKFLNSTRYHACVLTMINSTPMIGVSHDIRIEALFKESDLMNYYIDFRAPNLCDVMIEKTKQLVASEKECSAKIAASYPKFLDRCMKNRTDLRNWFNKELGPKFGVTPAPDKEVL
jgi:polysaccharide pyruvyl transferase WcaK-like protein